MEFKAKKLEFKQTFEVVSWNTSVQAEISACELKLERASWSGARKLKFEPIGDKLISRCPKTKT